MNQEKIGKFIARNRKAKKLTQEQLAEQLGVTNKSVSKWENGICLPDSSLYKPLCNLLDISLDELFEGESKQKNTTSNIKAVLPLIILSIIVCICVFFFANIPDVSYANIIEKTTKTDSIIVKVNDPSSEEFKLKKYKLITDKEIVKEIKNILYNSSLYTGPVNLPSSKYYLELLNEKGKLITKVEINTSTGHLFLEGDGYSHTLLPTEKQLSRLVELIET